MNIVVKKLTSDQIPELNEQNTLYIADCASIVAHHNFRSYENLAPWIIGSGITLVNEDAHLIHYPHDVEAIVAPASSDDRACIIERADFTRETLGSISQIYTFIPHPSIDTFANTYALPLNFSYNDFLKLNSKVAQKRLFHQGSPNWHVVTREEALAIKDKHSFFLKRDQGAGGEYVLRLDKAPLDDLDFENHVWFVEEVVGGMPQNVQFFKHGDEYVIYGFCEEVIKNTSEYVGCRILSIEKLEKEDAFLDFVKKAVQTCDPLLKDYQGFFGFDFMCDWVNNAFYFLEANVRFTSSTIPVLVNSAQNDGKEAFFMEEETAVPSGNVLVLTEDCQAKTIDFLQFL